MTTLQTTPLAAVLDLENLLHTARGVSPAAVRTQFLEIAAWVHALGEVRYAVGCCDYWLAKILAPVAAEAGVRIFPGPIGRDRADGELLRRAADIPDSAEVLIVGSGDRAFAGLLADQALAGRRTVVIGRSRSIATALRAAAHHVIELADPAAAVRRAA